MTDKEYILGVAKGSAQGTTRWLSPEEKQKWINVYAENLDTVSRKNYEHSEMAEAFAKSAAWRSVAEAELAEAKVKLTKIFALVEQQQANPYVLDNPTIRGIWETILSLREPREEGINNDR